MRGISGISPYQNMNRMSQKSDPSLDIKKGMTTNVDGSKGPSPFKLSSEAFLKILTTQLQNQDPLSPMDVSEFTNQLVMFSNAHQAMETNQRLEKILGMLSSFESINATKIVGKTIEVKGNEFEVNENSQFELSFDVPKDVRKATVQIFNEDGRLVRTVPAAMKPIFTGGKCTSFEADQIKPGKHQVVFGLDESGAPKGKGKFDGLDQESQKLPEGLYRMKVVGTKNEADGESFVELTTYVKGKVTSVDRGSGDEPEIYFGRASASMEDITSLGN